jgi:phage protein D
MSNYSTLNRYGTDFSVTFPDFPGFNSAPHWFRLYQEQGKQDVIEISYPSFSMYFYKTLKTGVPVQVTWTNELSKGEFVGYVYNVSMTTQATVKRNITIRAVGASFVLKEGGSKIWTNKTAPEIVADICKTFKLKAVCTPHTTRFSQQSMVGHTYWEKIQELGQRIGYVAQMIGTELHFHPIDNMINQFSTSIPVLAYVDGDINAGGVYEAQTLDKFKPTVGDIHEHGGHTKKTKVISGIDPITGKTYKATSSPTTVAKTVRASTSDPLFNHIIPTRVTDTPNMAKAMADAFAQLARFNVTAEGAGQGDSRISPYRLIEINGTGDTTDGFWIVNKAVHFVTYDGRYTVEFTCMTDGTDTNKPSAFRPTKAGVVPARNIAHEATTGAVSKPTTSKLNTKQAMIKQTASGFKVTPRRWVGK